MNTNKKIPKGSIIIGFPCIGKTTTSIFSPQHFLH